MFAPVNRHVLIEMPQAQEGTHSLIVLPDDYKPEEDRYVCVTALRSAPDIKIEIQAPAKLVVDRSMIEEIKIGPTTYSVILENYIVGIIE